MNIETFRERYPEFEAVGDSVVVCTLSETAGYVSPKVFGRLWERAHGQVCAHHLVLFSEADSEPAVSPITHKTAGDLSLQYAQGEDGFYSLTLYGRDFLQMKRLFANGFVRVC